MSNIDETLTERGSRYGEFDDHAAITQGIKDAMKSGRNWDDLDDDMKEALEMVAHKAGRILNGDPTYVDSWTDIIGYTRLVEKRLIAEQAVREGVTSAADKLKAVKEHLEGLLGRTPAPEQKCNCPKCEPEVHAAINLLIERGVISFTEG